MSAAIRRGTLLAVLLALALGSVLAAPRAAAHVTVSSQEAAAGGYAVLAFRVPDESGTALTTSLEIHLPADTPFTSVRTRPVPGWTAELVETDLDQPVTTSAGAEISRAVTVVRWTADDPASAIGPGEFGQFELSVGPLPEQGGTLFFPTLQGYDDGTEVAWAEQAEEGASADLPAPSLVVTADGAASDAHGAPVAAAAESEDVATAPSAAEPVLPLVLSAAALVLAAAALVLAIRRGRRPALPRGR